MKQILRTILAGMLTLAGCAPRQDPGIPLPSHQAAADALHRADVAVGKKADLVAGIDEARRLVAFNLANAETIGFKAASSRVINGHAVIALDVSQGSMCNTGRDMDVAISGRDAFFRVKVPLSIADGYAYTRNGNLFRNKDGDLVVGMGDGFRVDPPINIPNSATHIIIDQDGRVSAMLPGQTAKQQLGQINLYQFSDATALASLGDSIYLATDASGSAIEFRPGDNGVCPLQQGFLETSNVELNRERLRTAFLERWRSTVLASADTGP